MHRCATKSRDHVHTRHRAARGITRRPTHGPTDARRSSPRKQLRRPSFASKNKAKLFELLPILGDSGLLISVVLILIGADLCLAQRSVPVEWHTQLGDLGLEKAWKRIRAGAAVAAPMRRAAHAVKARVQRLPHVWLLHRCERFCREGFEDVQADRLRNRCVPADSGNGQEEGAASQGRGRAEAALSGGLRGVLAA